MRKKTNVPAERSTFVGRRRELATVAALLRNKRLVSLLGPPGIGKTALALKHARARPSLYSGGVWFVDAQGVRTSGDLSRAVASAVGIDARAGEPDLDVSVGRRLADHGPILVVLDNFDDAVRRAATTLGTWTASAAKARFLVTSREALNIEGEQRMDLGPLDQGRSNDGVQLFLERARAVRSGYAPSPALLVVIKEIVSRLEGNPLAIELAATRLTTVSERELLTWLPRDIDGAIAGRALRRAIARSWALLSPGEQRALAACSVFSGGFSLDAAASVLPPRGSPLKALERLQALRDKSLLFIDEHADTTRYGLYESISAFARAKLNASGLRNATEQHHAEFYVRAAAGWQAQSASDGSVEALDALVLESKNLAAVIERGLRKGADRNAYLHALHTLVAEEPRVVAMGPIAPYLALLDSALEKARAPYRVSNRVVLSVLLARGKARTMSGRTDGLPDLERARAMARRLADLRLTGLATLEIGVAHLRQGMLDVAYRDFSAARELFRRVGERELEGNAVGRLGLVRYREGKLDEALARYEEQAPLLSPNVLQRSDYHARLGGIHHDRGAFAAADAEYRRALVIARRARSRRREAIALGALGVLYWEMGRYDRSRKTHERAIAVIKGHGDRAYEGICLASLGGVEALAGNLLRASRLIARARLLVAPERDQRILNAVDLYDAIVVLAASARLARKHPVRASELRDRARSQIARATAAEQPSGEDTRVALRIIRSSFGRDATGLATREHLHVHAGRKWFQLDGRVVSLATKPTLGNLLFALGDRHARQPGQAMTTFELLDAGWPAQSIGALAGTNRVYVALAALRKLGLTRVLLRTADGYRLSPTLDVTFTDDRAPS
jgi:predicted ATPase